MGRRGARRRRAAPRTTRPGGPAARRACPATWSLCLLTGEKESPGAEGAQRDERQRTSRHRDKPKAAAGCGSLSRNNQSVGCLTDTQNIDLDPRQKAKTWICFHSAFCNMLSRSVGESKRSKACVFFLVSPIMILEHSPIKVDPYNSVGLE